MFAGLLFLTTGTLDAKVKIHSITSPDGKLELQVVTDTNISFCLLHTDQVLVSSVPLSLSLEDRKSVG